MATTITETAQIATNLAGFTSEVASQLAALTSESNTKVAVALAEIKGEIHEINGRLGDFVPSACIAHNHDLITLVGRISEVETFRIRLDREHETLKEKVTNYEKRITGLYVLSGGLTVSVLAGIVIAVIKYVGTKGG